MSFLIWAFGLYIGFSLGFMFYCFIKGLPYLVARKEKGIVVELLPKVGSIFGAVVVTRYPMLGLAISEKAFHVGDEVVVRYNRKTMKPIVDVYMCHIPQIFKSTLVAVLMLLIIIALMLKLQ